ncbi:MAG: hypothetical protein HY751_03060 [Nitrospinae bacterium]|nr:hypothetical protein [Nitrospinota bacterium]
MTQILGVIRFLFELRGAMAGYKTYIASAAGILAATAAFLTGDVTPFLEGGITGTEFITKSLPDYITTVTGFFAVGALRVGMESSPTKR